jgi:uncharacterized membrane protein YfcA
LIDLLQQSMLPCPTAALGEVNLWALGGVGLLAGLLGAMLGVGGGILVVPMLTLALHVPIHIAIASSLVSIVATSCIAASVYVRNRLTNIKLGLLLETTTTPGAIIGALTATRLTSSVLGILFGAISIYVAYTMAIRQPVPTKDTQPEDSPTTNANELANSYYDKSLSKIVSYKVSHIPLGLGSSFFAGILSSLLGIGGGIVNVPIMNLVMGIPMKATIATSSFMIAITTTVGAFIYYYHGYVYPPIVAPLIVGVFLGARIGAELAQRTTGILLRRIFGMFLFITAILMFLQAAKIL